MKKNNTRLLLIVALLIALAAASFGIARSNKAKTEGQKKQTAEAVTEQTEEQQEEAGPLATVFFASDYQPEAGFDAPADTLRALLKAAKADGKTIDRIVICGDYTNDRVLFCMITS